MAEEIRIVVKQESQGTALADARRDADELAKVNKEAGSTGASSPAGGKVDWAALKAQQQQAMRSMAGDSAPQGGGAAAAAALERELALASELEALQAKASGDMLGSAHLEREAEILARSLTIQRNTTMSREEALGFARAQIDAEAQITSNQKMQALEKKSSGDSAKDDSRKAAALEKETALYTNLNIARARASGDMLGAAYLEQEAEIMARASQIQRETTLSKEQAVGLARTQVGLEAQIASNIRMQAVEQRQITQEKKAQGSAGDGGDGGGGGSKISAPRAGGGGQILRNFMDAETIGKIFVAKYVFDQVFNTVASIAHAEDALAKRRYQADMESIDRTSELIRISKSTHSSGEAQSKAEQIGEELDKAKEKQGLAMPEETMGDHMKLALDAIFGEGFRDKFGELGKTNAEKGDDDDLYKKGQLENAKKLADKEANQKFTHGEGGMALDKQAKELGGDFKGAKEIQMKIDRQREYNRLRKEGASEEQANQGADMKIEQERRQEAQKFGHLVNARSGAGDIAAAAKLAENATHAQGHAATASAVRDLHKSMDRNHGEGMAQYQNHTRKRF